MLQLQDIASEWIDARTKGIPGTVSPFRLGDIAKQQWNVLNQDLPLPLLVLKETPLEENLKTLQSYCAAKGVDLAPHGKTTMCPQLFQKQLAHGAWGMTVATVNQMQVYRSVGIQRILLANQLVGRQAVETVIQHLNDDPEFEFFSLVDSCALTEHLVRELDRGGLKKPLQVLLEIGQEGGRCGCRSLEEARQICQALGARPDLFSLVGFELYEGIMPTAAKAQQFLDEAVSWIQDLADEISPACPEVLLTAGGSHYFDLVVQSFQSLELARPRRIVLRSGCYLTHDHGAYEQAQREGEERGNWPSELKPALELWSYVQSRPEDTLAILTMGKRD
ncbi:MAG: alanine racemase, partial [Kiritimatiellia bacterium]